MEAIITTERWAAAANGCATPSAPAGGPYNNTFKDDCDLGIQAAQTVKRLEGYFEWAKLEPKVIGFYPVRQQFSWI